MFGKQKRQDEKLKGVADSVKERIDAGLPLDDDAPWVNARLHHDDRFLRLAAHAENWRKFALVSLALAGVAIAGVVYIGQQSKFIPFVVEVDKLGRTLAIRKLDDKQAMSEAEKHVFRELSDFIENARSVTVDYSANNRALNRAFSRVEGPAYEFLKQELKAHKPNEVATSKTVSVEVKTLLPDTNSTWVIEWVETSYNLKGESLPNPELWKAKVHFELRPGSTKQEDIMSNPDGFHIKWMSWTRQM